MAMMMEDGCLGDWRLEIGDEEIGDEEIGGGEIFAKRDFMRKPIAPIATASFFCLTKMYSGDWT